MITGELCKSCGHPDYDHKNGHCHWKQHGALLACYCTTFVSPTAEAVTALSYEEQKVLACASYLGIDPKHISRVETTTDSGGHFAGLKVIIDISIGRQVDKWVETNIPKEAYEWIVKYLVQKISNKGG
ncbi:MAG: hypothetical protein Q7S34_00400 [bacterium]|nr:hypothetical protein [bacterium]